MHASETASMAAEAARYALLRRLAPAMRHHLVVNLQPISMIHEMLERRLDASEPDVVQLREGVHKIHGFSRAALQSCLDVVGWLAPDESVATTAREGVRECIGLLATSLSFRGYALRNEVPELPGALSRSAVRTMLAGALIHLTDRLEPPASLILRARRLDGGVCFELAGVPNGNDPGFVDEVAYRWLDWQDVQALAVACGTQVETEGETIRITCPWLAPAAQA